MSDDCRVVTVYLECKDAEGCSETLVAQQIVHVLYGTPDMLVCHLLSFGTLTILHMCSQLTYMPIVRHCCNLFTRTCKSLLLPTCIKPQQTQDRKHHGVRTDSKGSMLRDRLLLGSQQLSLASGKSIVILATVQIPDKSSGLMIGLQELQPCTLGLALLPWTEFAAPLCTH